MDMFYWVFQSFIGLPVFGTMFVGRDNHSEGSDVLLNSQ